MGRKKIAKKDKKQQISIYLEPVIAEKLRATGRKKSKILEELLTVYFKDLE